MRTFRETICCIFLLAISAAASTTGTNYTVKAGGGGNYATIQACVNAMAAGDTCTVYAGTYNERVTVPTGTVGNYKTITVNGSDTISVLGFTLNSHTKLIGNCPTKQGTVTTATCGFFISNPSSPGTACVNLPNNTTDVYIGNNVMYACGPIGPGWPTVTSYIYIQGNTVAYTNTTTSLLPTSCGDTANGHRPVSSSVSLNGDHYLVENNDFSHYTISIGWQPQYSVVRNNNFHDTVEANNAGNCHSDVWYSEPGVAGITVQYNLFEGNFITSLGGPNAKMLLAQDDNNRTCPNCNHIISRHNVVSKMGSGAGSNYYWEYIKSYNNTIVDAMSNLSLTSNDADNSETTDNSAYLNQLYWFSASGTNFNVYGCGSNCNNGHNLYWCTGTCTTVHGHTYGVGTFLGESGNKNANPLFVNYVSPGSTSNDYHLQAGSPAIGAGTYLTTVASGDSGSGTSLVVNDATYFQDGYGLSNDFSTVSGDCIAVGTASNHVCVTAVNYATNTLTLAGSISRSKGQGVYLYSKSDGVQVLTGSAPDMGAYPYGAPDPPKGLAAVVN